MIIQISILGLRIKKMSARKGQTRLKKIAIQISQNKQLSPEDKEFLVKALIEISNGGDAETALGVKFKKGERKSKYAKDTNLIYTVSLSTKQIKELVKLSIIVLKILFEKFY